MRTVEPVVIENEEIIPDNAIFTGSGIETPVKYEIDYWDKANPRSVMNLMPIEMRHNAAGAKLYNLLKLDEIDLRHKVTPTPTVNRLRLSFWREYERAQARGTPIVATNIYAGICPKNMFLKVYFYNKEYMAWILKPPVDYATAMEEALSYGIDRLRDILELPIYITRRTKLKGADGKQMFDEKTGEPLYHVETEPNTKVCELILKTVAMLDMRVKGALVHKIEQRIENRNLNVNANLDGNVSDIRANQIKEQLKIDNKSQIKSLEQIDKELEKLKLGATDLYADASRLVNKPLLTHSEKVTAIENDICIDEMQIQIGEDE